MKRSTAAIMALSMLLSLTACNRAAVVSETSEPSELETTEETTEEQKGISVGDHILFGYYPQRSAPGTDNFDPEPIEWRVLDIQDRNAVIISEYLLDATVYYFDMADVTWEMSSLRKWLNGKLGCINRFPLQEISVEWGLIFQRCGGIMVIKEKVCVCYSTRKNFSTIYHQAYFQEK